MVSSQQRDDGCLQLFLKIWDKEEISADSKDAAIVTVFRKEDEVDSGSYREISLFSVTRKIIFRIFARCLPRVSEVNLPESQCVFQPNSGIMDMVSSPQQLQEKCQKQKQPLSMAFIHLTKVFDSVRQEVMWKNLSKADCPVKFTNILCPLYVRMSTMGVTNSNMTESTEVQTRIKQRCFITCILFSIFIATALHLVKNKLPSDVDMVYRRDRKLYNLNHLKSKKKTSLITLVDSRYLIGIDRELVHGQ
eukprot:g48207.t1